MHNSANTKASPQLNTASRMITTREAAAYLGLSASHLNKMRVAGSGPVFVKLSRSVRYRLQDLDMWVTAHRYSSTSAVQMETASMREVAETPAG